MEKERKQKKAVNKDGKKSTSNSGRGRGNMSRGGQRGLQSAHNSLTSREKAVLDREVKEHTHDRFQSGTDWMSSAGSNNLPTFKKPGDLELLVIDLNDPSLDLPHYILMQQGVSSFTVSKAWTVTLKTLTSSIATGFMIAGFVRNTEELDSIVGVSNKQYSAKQEMVGKIANLPGSSGIQSISRTMNLSASFPSQWVTVQDLLSKSVFTKENKEKPLPYLLVLWQYSYPTESVPPIGAVLAAIKVHWHVKLGAPTNTSAGKRSICLSGGSNANNVKAKEYGAYSLLDLKILNFNRISYDTLYTAEISDPVDEDGDSKLVLQPGWFLVDIILAGKPSLEVLTLKAEIRGLKDYVMKFLNFSVKGETTECGTAQAIIRVGKDCQLIVQMNLLSDVKLDSFTRISPIDEATFSYLEDYPTAQIQSTVTEKGSLVETVFDGTLPSCDMIPPTAKMSVSDSIKFDGINFGLVLVKGIVFPKMGSSILPRDLLANVISGSKLNGDYIIPATVSPDVKEAIKFGYFLLQLKAKGGVSKEPLADKYLRGALPDGSIPVDETMYALLVTIC